MCKLLPIYLDTETVTIFICLNYRLFNLFLLKFCSFLLFWILLCTCFFFLGWLWISFNYYFWDGFSTISRSRFRFFGQLIIKFHLLTLENSRCSLFLGYHTGLIIRNTLMHLGINFFIFSILPHTVTCPSWRSIVYTTIHLSLDRFCFFLNTSWISHIFCRRGVVCFAWITALVTHIISLRLCFYL